jgi:hypothetical protein
VNRDLLILASTITTNAGWQSIFLNGGKENIKDRCGLVVCAGTQTSYL